MSIVILGVDLGKNACSVVGVDAAGAVLVFLTFVVATAEIALAIPIVLLLVRNKRTLDIDAYSDLKG